MYKNFATKLLAFYKKLNVFPFGTSHRVHLQPHRHHSGAKKCFPSDSAT
jgi:hypothetical protein